MPTEARQVGRVTLGQGGVAQLQEVASLGNKDRLGHCTWQPPEHGSMAGRLLLSITVNTDCPGVLQGQGSHTGHMTLGTEGEEVPSPGRPMGALMHGLWLQGRWGSGRGPWCHLEPVSHQASDSV